MAFYFFSLNLHYDATEMLFYMINFTQVPFRQSTTENQALGNFHFFLKTFSHFQCNEVCRSSKTGIPLLQG